MSQYKVIVPNEGRAVLSQIPPFAALVTLDEGAPSVNGSNLRVYRDADNVQVALYDYEVEAVPTKAVQDVTVEVAGAKATFTGTDSKAGYIVAGVVVIVVAGIAVLGRFNPDLFNIILK